MSILFYLFKSWVIGFAIAAPVGPVGMLCIKKTLELGLKGAILVGLGAAVADSVYGMIGALGLSFISHILVGNSSVLKLIGGIFLLYLAYKESVSKVVSDTAHIDGKGEIRLVLEVFFLTLTNPMTILSFIGIFASIGSGAAGALESIIMVIGIFLGSMTWWFLLGSLIAKIKHKLPKIWFSRIKWVSCIILISFGLVAIVSSF